MKSIVIVAVLAALAAGGNLLYQKYDSKMSEVSYASMAWPSVSGIVTHSNLESRANRIGNDKKTEFDIQVTYEYVVDDQVYRNDVVRFDQNRLARDNKELLVSSHAVGKRVEVFYDPADPAQSVLVRGSYTEGN